MSVHWLPWYIGDHKRDTAHLSTLEDGAYRRLIDHYWMTGPLPDDDQQLATITGLSIWQWRRIKPTIIKFFSPSPRTDKISTKSLAVMNLANASPLWFHKRLEGELVKAENKDIQRRLAGQLGGIRKAARLHVLRYETNKFSAKPTDQGLANALANDLPPTPTPTPTKDLKKGVGEDGAQVVSEPTPMTVSPYLVESINEKVKRWNGS
jgi:uncharacterized protein YdaU (DUF1376 family)